MQTVRAVVVPAFQHVLGRVEALRESVEAEAGAGSVHDLRVAVRRLCTALVVMRPVLLPPHLRPGQFRRLERRLGRLRDLDIASQWLDETALGELGLDPDRDLARLRRALLRRRRRCAERLSRTLGKKALLRRMALARAWVETPRLSATADAPVATVAPDLVAPLFSAVALHPGWHEPWPPGFTGVTHRRLHQLRRRLKRLRDAAEFLEPAWSSASSAWLAEWRAVLEGLGTWHDLGITATWVARGGGHPLAPEALGRRAGLALVDWPSWRASWTDGARLARRRAQVLMPD